MKSQLTEMIRLITPAAPSGTTTLLRLISLTTNESDGRCVHILEPNIMKTIYKTLQSNPISCKYINPTIQTNKNQCNPSITLRNKLHLDLK